MVDETTNDLTPTDSSSLPDDSQAPASPLTQAAKPTPFAPAPAPAPKPAPGLPQAQYVSPVTKKPVPDVVPGAFGQPEFSDAIQKEIDEKNAQASATAAQTQEQTEAEAHLSPLDRIVSATAEKLARLATAPADKNPSLAAQAMTAGPLLHGAASSFDRALALLHTGASLDAAIDPRDQSTGAAYGRGLLSSLGGFTSPDNLLLLGGMETLPAGAKAVTGLVFTGLAAKGLKDDAVEFTRAVKQGDWKGAARIAGAAVPNAAFTAEGLRNIYSAAPGAFQDAAAQGREKSAARAQESADYVNAAKTGDVLDISQAAPEGTPQIPEKTGPQPELPPHVTFESIGGTEVKAPEPATRPSELSPNREVMQQDHARAGGQGEQTDNLPALHPEEHAELEQQAGRPLTTAEAANFRNNQLITQTNQRMAATGEGTRDEVSNAREPHRAELEPVGVGSALESRKAPEIQAEGPEWERTHNIIVDGNKVGSVMVKTDPEGHAQLAGAVVDPSRRGQGLAQAAYRSAIAEAQANGATRITSDSTHVSPDANRVWEALKAKGLPVENITHPNGTKGYQIDFENPAEVSLPATKATFADAAKTAGVDFRGVQQGMGDKAIAIFQDPVSKTSFTVDTKDWSPEKFQTSLKAARDRMTPPEPKFEQALARRGEMPHQTVNLAPAYGETGKYVGGHVEHRLAGSPEEKRQQYIDNLGVTQGTAPMEIPAHLMTEGGSTEDVLGHELAHIIFADRTGIPTKGSFVQTHLHPETSAGAGAVTHLDYSQIPGTTALPNGMVLFSQPALKEFWPKALKTYMAGIVSQEMVHGLPTETNDSGVGDKHRLHQLGSMLGFTPEEIDGMIAGTTAQLKQEMTADPKLINLIKTASSTREEGLSRTLHFSEKRVQEILKQDREARNGGNTQANDGRHGAVVSATDSEATGRNAESNLREGDGKSVPTRTESSKVKTAHKPKAEDIIARAVEHYGVTDNINKAGFILPDGLMLDFSDGQGARTIDHGDISAVHDGENPREHFVADTGAVRIIHSPRQNYVGVDFDLEHPPTDAQLEQVEPLLKKGVTVEVGISSEDTTKTGTINPYIGGHMAEAEDMDGLRRVVQEARKSANQKLLARQQVLSKADSRKQSKGEKLIERAKENGFPVASPDDDVYPPERAYIAPNGDYLDAGENDHYGVSNLYDDKNGDPTVEDEEAIVKFMNDTGAVRYRFDGDNLLVHLGDTKPTNEQLSAMAKAYNEHGDTNISASPSAIQIARDGKKYPNDGASKTFPDTMRAGELRREIEGMYPKDASVSSKLESRKESETVIPPSGEELHAAMRKAFEGTTGRISDMQEDGDIGFLFKDGEFGHIGNQYNDAVTHDIAEHQFYSSLPEEMQKNLDYPEFLQKSGIANVHLGADGELNVYVPQNGYLTSEQIGEIVSGSRKLNSPKVLVSENILGGKGRLAEIDHPTPATLSAKLRETFGEQQSKTSVSPKLESRKAPSVSPNKTLQASAQKYAAAHDMPEIDHAPVEADPERAKEIAKIYDEAEHAPNDPRVKAAYDAFKAETLEQFHHLRDDLGLKFDPTEKDPYSSAAEMMADIKKNNRLKVFTGSSTGEDHPLSAIAPGTGGNSYNTVLRWAHDAMGHAAGGHDFSENGEKSATEAHAQMYSDTARPAMRAETEGQTSWFFHNPEVESGRAEPGKFAEQKAIILPDTSADWHKKAGDMAASQDAGGINPRTGKSDTKGKGVELIPELRQPLTHVPTAADFHDFYEQRKELYDDYPQLRVGWDNNSGEEGGHEINVGAVGPGAPAVAKKLDQIAAFDIEKGENIPTGGSGKTREFPDYSLDQRLEDLGASVSPKLEARKQPTAAHDLSFISPDGQVHPLRASENIHEQAARRLMKKFDSGFKPASAYGVDGDESDEFQQNLMSRGWVRKSGGGVLRD